MHRAVAEGAVGDAKAHQEAKGWELALEEINAAGGVNGRKLEIVSRDDGGTPGDAVRVAEELLAREKVSVLMGTFASNVGLAVSNLAGARLAVRGTVANYAAPQPRPDIAFNFEAPDMDRVLKLVEDANIEAVG